MKKKITGLLLLIVSFSSFAEPQYLNCLIDVYSEGRIVERRETSKRLNQHGSYFDTTTTNPSRNNRFKFTIAAFKSPSQLPPTYMAIHATIVDLQTNKELKFKNRDDSIEFNTINDLDMTGSVGKCTMGLKTYKEIGDEGYLLNEYNKGQRFEIITARGEQDWRFFPTLLEKIQARSSAKNYLRLKCIEQYEGKIVGKIKTTEVFLSNSSYFTRVIVEGKCEF